MKKYLTPLSLVWLVSFLGAIAAGEPIAFSKVKEGESLELRFQTQGCFGGACYDFTFLPGADKELGGFHGPHAPRGS